MATDVEATEKPIIEGLTDKEAAFVEHIREGLTVREASKAAGVPKSTIRFWLADPRRATFRAEYAKAKQDQADAFFDKILDTAHQEDGDPQNKRLLVDTLKWAAARRNPKVYGEKLEVSGSVDINLSGMSDEDLRNRALAAIQQWGFFLAPLPSRADHRDHIREQALGIMREAHNYLDAYDRLIEAGFIIVAPPPGTPKTIEALPIGGTDGGTEDDADE